MTDIRFLHRAAFDAFLRARKALIISHKKPDGDTLGAATATLHFCRGRGIDAVAFCADVVPEPYRFMPRTEEFTADPSVFAAGFDLVAVFDAGDLRFAGVADFIAAMSVRPVIINFDHHATNERFGDVNIVDVTASSTAEVVYHFLRSCDATIDQATATCLLTGILTDTGGFSNPATSSSALEAASDLLRRGAKIQEVSNRLVRNKTIPSLRLWGQVLSRLKHSDRFSMATTAIFASDMEAGIEDDHVEGVSNFLNNFLNVKVVMVLREMPGGKVKGSLRTADAIDVSALAKALGGGGHKKAAGFTVAGRIVEGAEGWRVVK